MNLHRTFAFAVALFVTFFGSVLPARGEEDTATDGDTASDSQSQKPTSVTAPSTTPSPATTTSSFQNAAPTPPKKPATLPAKYNAASEADFKVKETTNKIELSTPWGVKSYQTDFNLGAMKHYRIEIPLEDLRPPMTPVQTQPEPARDVASQPAPTINPVIQTTCEAPKQEPKDVDRKPAAIPDTPSEYDNTDRLIFEANHLYNRGKFYEASVYVEELIRKNPILVRAWVMKGSLLYMQGYKDLAKKAWTKAAELDPKDPEVADILKRYP